MAPCKVKIPGCVQDILSISAYGRSTFYFHEALDAVALDSVWHLLLSKLLDNRTAMGTKVSILHIVQVPIIKQVKNQTDQQSFQLTFLDCSGIEDCFIN
jgi:hypothetical protein